MLYVVKRTKKPPPGNEPPGPPAVHYAAEAGPAGNVTAWVKDRAQAKGFTDDEAGRILAFYAGVANAGAVDVEPARPPAPPEPVVPAPPAAPVVLPAMPAPPAPAAKVESAPQRAPAQAADAKRGRGRGASPPATGE